MQNAGRPTHQLRPGWPRPTDCDDIGTVNRRCGAGGRVLRTQHIGQNRSPGGPVLQANFRWPLKPICGLSFTGTGPAQGRSVWAISNGNCGFEQHEARNDFAYSCWRRGSERRHHRPRAAAIRLPLSRSRPMTRRGRYSGAHVRPGMFRRFVADFLAKNVSFAGNYAPGTIVVNTSERRLYLVTGKRPGDPFTASGVGARRPSLGNGHTVISAKKEMPDWTAARGRCSSAEGDPAALHARGGPSNPLGAARAM